MLSASQLQMANIRNDESVASKVDVSPETSLSTATKSSSIVAQTSTTVTLSATAQMLQATTKLDAVIKALEGLKTSDANKNPKVKSKLDKFLQHETLLTLLDRWELEREVRKCGGANAGDAERKLKNMEQLKDLF